jgi:site-specific DNA-methyltransferase (adenine-specific)
MAYTIHTGSNLDILPTLPDNSVDSIVTDPPYELGFMGKSWDSTGIAYNVALWRECLRVLKPGGHLLAFSGSRTYHRMTVAIEDAGFEIRDQMMWVYGSGFPKSHNISKALDKMEGVEFKNIPANGVGFMNPRGDGGYNKTLNQMVKVGESSASAQQWNGWGTALKPAHEPICLARKPLEGTVADNVLKWGVGGINIDGCRVGFVSEEDKKESTQKNQHADFDSTIGTNQVYGDYSMLKPKNYNPPGRFPSNLMHDGSPEVLDLFPESNGGAAPKKANTIKTLFQGGWNGIEREERIDFGSGSAARFFYCPKASKSDRNDGCDDFEERRESDRIKDDGIGGDNPRNRTNNPRKNFHPTVKPTELMAYLCRLITPPGGTILDPFTGSGSTGRGAVSQGFNFIGIELSPEYVEIAKARIEASTTKTK